MAIQLRASNKKNYVVNARIKDIRAIKNLRVRKVSPHRLKNIEKIIVEKPWGFEYLCGTSRYFEVWELHLAPGHATSLHCHPNKDTLNIIIEGEVQFETSQGKITLASGEFKIIKAGSIHRTRNVTKKSVRLIEIESPPRKYDLIRLVDGYGRENLPYSTDGIRRPRGLKKKVCLRNPPHSMSNGFHYKEFISKESLYGHLASKAIHELALNKIGSANPEALFLETLQNRKANNIMITSGFAIVQRGRRLYRLSPGDCIFETPLWKFHWSAKKCTAFLW